MINLQVKLTPYNIIYLAHARPKHVVHATSIIYLAHARPKHVVHATSYYHYGTTVTRAPQFVARSM